MQPPPLPEDELERLAALHARGILDTPPEERFDRLTRITQRALGVSTVLISLIDSDRQWFKSRQGLEACETPREISFCGHAILARDIFEVQDTWQDPRFQDNPLVTGEPFIRFYAGVPLFSASGFALGTLCLLDPHPGKLDTGERQQLVDLAACVESEINKQVLEQVRERAEKLKGEFVSMVSHELRTPLTSISGALGLLDSGILGSFSAEADQMLDIAYNNSKRLTFLINDLLDIEKLSSGKMHFDMQPQPLAPMIRQSVKALSTYGQEREITIDIPEPLAEVTVTVDAQRLQQVLANLLSNALKFSHPGGQIELGADYRDGRVEVSVQDHGRGISAEFQERMFEKFAQAEDVDTRTRGGTGLGLAISREMVERMNGEIGFHSIEGEGARFHFTLPASPLAAKAATPTRVATTVDGARKRSAWQVLVIEDDLDLCRVLEAQIGKDVGLEHAGTLGEARTRVALEDFDVILLDIGLPDGSGWTLVPEIRTRLPEARIVVLTAQEVPEADRASVDEVLLKTRTSPEAMLAAMGVPQNDQLSKSGDRP
ncbi:ATP-binding protein [Halomonas aquatica]|uniref:histidine kinase n=1 Tax=Halomonas aquatica TaxID=3151123 RepID=A0ABV1NCD1_9GAMM